MREDVTLNGVSLDTYCFGLRDVSNLFTVPARRGGNTVVPGRHGSIRTPNKRFEEAEYVLPLWLLGAEEDGSVPSGSTEAVEFWKRRDELLQLLYSPDLIVEYTRPDEIRVQAHCEVVDAVDFTRRGDEPIALVNIALANTGAFWEDAVQVTQVVTGPTDTIQTLDAFVGATAPMDNLRIRFDGPVNNPLLVHGQKTVQYHGVIDAGQQLVINTRDWQLTPGTGTPWSPDLRQVEFFPGPTYFELDPATPGFDVQFSHTGGGSASCQITGPRKYLSA